MITTWTLILVFWGRTSPAAVSINDFASRESCIAAQNVAVKINNLASATCIPVTRKRP